jgi:hypothetical protein
VSFCGVDEPASTPRGETLVSAIRLASQKFSEFSNRLKLTPCSCFVLIESQRELAMGLDHLRSEIAFMRVQVSRQRKEILQLQRTGIPTTSGEALLQRMLDKIDGLCAERDRLKAELPKPKGKVLGGRTW